MKKNAAADSTTFLTLPPDTIIAGRGLITIPLPGFQLAGVLGADFSTAVLYSPAGQMAAGEEAMPAKPELLVAVEPSAAETEPIFFKPQCIPWSLFTLGINRSRSCHDACS